MALSLAMSTTGWAVIGAVGGALVGAVAGGLIDMFIASLRERAEAKAGARLIAAEVASMDSHLESAESEGQWWRFYGIEITNWDEYKAILAKRLKYKQFAAVSQAVLVLENTRQQMAVIPAFRKDPDLPFVPLDRKNIRPIRVDAANGYNALAKLAGHGVEGELLTHPPRPRPDDGGAGTEQSPG